MKIRIKEIKNIFIIMSVIVIFLFSKTYFLGVLNRAWFQYVFYAVIIIGFAFCRFSKTKLQMNMLLIVPFVFLFGASIVIHINDMSSININTIARNLLAFICIALAASYISKEKFVCYYLRLLSIYCLISLLCWGIAITNKNLAYALCQPGYAWPDPYGYSWFYTWGWNGTIFTRNSGPFWEPGAFQGFIILGMLMLLFDVDNGASTKRKQIFILLGITLLTTQSTTGYILAILIITVFLKRVEKIFGDINKSTRKLIVLLLALGVVIIVFSSGNIIDKLNGVDNHSAETRSNDFFGGMIMSVTGGVFGYGETSTKMSVRLIYGIDDTDSCGLFNMIYTYGWLFGGYYIWLLNRGLKIFFSPNFMTEHMILVLTFFVLHCTEGLWYLPVYLMIIIQPKDSIRLK